MKWGGAERGRAGQGEVGRMGCFWFGEAQFGAGETKARDKRSVAH